VPLGWLHVSARKLGTVVGIASVLKPALVLLLSSLKDSRTSDTALSIHPAGIVAGEPVIGHLAKTAPEL
jgi:hypothetical protein